MDLARGLAFALYGHGIDEEFVMSRIENMRRQFHGHAIIDCFHAFPGRDGFEQKFGCVHAAQMIDWHPIINESRSEEHTSELQSLMRISYAVFCLKKKKTQRINKHNK